MEFHELGPLYIAFEERFTYAYHTYLTYLDIRLEFFLPVVPYILST